jgi:hypothetical protein
VSRRRATYTNFTWAEDTATQGCDRSADPAAGMAGRREPPLKLPFWREGDKSQGFGDRVPKKNKALRPWPWTQLQMRARLWSAMPALRSAPYMLV